MQSRKLQQVGGGTYTVSIPKDWADEHSLQAGMDLHLYTHTDGSIVLRASEKDGGKLAAARVEIDGQDPELVERALQSIHVVGFETVTLEPATEFSDEQRRTARSAVRNFVGADLAVESADEIVVRHLLDASNVSVRQSVVQLQFTALSVHRHATAAVLDGDGDAVDRLIDRRDEAHRLARMVTRHFQRSLISFDEIDRLGVARPALFDFYVAARALERVTGHSLVLARVAESFESGIPGAVATELREPAAEVRTHVDNATGAVLDGNTVADAHGVLDDHAVVVAAIEGVERSLFEDAPASVSTESVAAAIRVLDTLRRTADAGATIGRVGLGASTRSRNADVGCD